MPTPDYVLASSARVLGQVLPLLKRTPGPVADTALYASYRRKLAVLAGDTRAASRSATLAADLETIVSGYRAAASDMAAVIAGLERVLAVVRAFVPVEPRSGSLAAQRRHELGLTGLIEVLALSEIAEAVALLQPASHDAATRLRGRLSRHLDAAIERASERGDTDVLRALRETHAWLVRDLIERGRPLARMVGYETAVPLPAVVLAHMLYQDAGRSAELVAENPRHDHPGFMPMSGRALSR